MPTLTMAVNRLEVTIDVPPEVSLLSVLRDNLGLTGAKVGCAEGACGTCTALLDGAPARACITPAAAAAGRHVLTIEGLAGMELGPQAGAQSAPQAAEDAEAPPGGAAAQPAPALHPLQRAFLAEAAFQCGYCTPGMIMAAAGLLRERPDPTDAEIVAHMQGNICRCGMYARVLRAIRRAAEELRAAEGAAA